jgi:hypothetical protein
MLRALPEWLPRGAVRGHKLDPWYQVGARTVRSARFSDEMRTSQPNIELPYPSH